MGKLKLQLIKKYKEPLLKWEIEEYYEEEGIKIAYTLAKFREREHAEEFIRRVLGHGNKTDTDRQNN